MKIESREARSERGKGTFLNARGEPCPACLKAPGTIEYHGQDAEEGGTYNIDAFLCPDCAKHERALDELFRDPRPAVCGLVHRSAPFRHRQG